jgi:Sensors of blue-light using FAD
MIELMYYSRNRRDEKKFAQLTALRDILTTAMRVNAELGITGFLILKDDWFLQILEGEEDKVNTLYSRICGDPRHEECTVIRRQKIMVRSFGKWSMGGMMFTPEQEAVYLENGLGTTFDPRTIDAQTAHNLLSDLKGYEMGRLKKAG